MITALEEARAELVQEKARNAFTQGGGEGKTGGGELPSFVTRLEGGDERSG